MFDHLQASQRQDGSCTACNGPGVGSVYSTAVWCTILQFDRTGRHGGLARADASKDKVPEKYRVTVTKGLDF